MVNKTLSELRKREWQDPIIRAKRLKRSGMLGKKHSQKTKELWSKKRKGTHNSPETEFKPSGKKPENAYKFLKGESNPSWAGGIYRTLRQNIMKLPEYYQWRKGVLKRDHYTCQNCFKIGGELEVDHIYPYIKIINENVISNLVEALSCADLWNLSNGKTLCKECHKNTKTYGHRVKL